MKRTIVRTLKLFAGLAILVPLGAEAKRQELPMSVQPAGGGDVSAAPASGAVTRSGKSALLVRIHNSCFGTNLRSVANPLSPDANIEARMEIAFANKSFPIRVKYPAEIVARSGLVQGPAGNAAFERAKALVKNQADLTSPNQTAIELNAGAFTIPGGGRAGIYGNVVQLEIPVDSLVTVSQDGTMTTALQGRPSMASKSFTQLDVNGGEFMGKTGPLTASFDGLSVAADNSAIDLNVSFPGQEGFCGGYHSPLMLFFSDARPRFTETTDFPLSPTGLTKWPEAGAPGYFLVLDDGTGKVTRREQLFGDAGRKGMNGFEELAKYDKNKDGWIDAKDPVFKKLKLWNDKNGDGVVQKGELVSLKSMKILKISLKYDPKSLRMIGETAEERESSHFVYMKNGKETKGDIVDVWLAPVMKRMAASEK